MRTILRSHFHTSARLKFGFAQRRGFLLDFDHENLGYASLGQTSRAMQTNVDVLYFVGDAFAIE